MVEFIETDDGRQWRELATKAQSGDAAAYRSLLSGLVPMIRKMIVKSLPNPQNADDVVQEILISVHRALHTYDSRRPFLPWINAIIQFRKTDYLRQYYAQHDNAKLSLDCLHLKEKNLRL